MTTLWQKGAAGVAFVRRVCFQPAPADPPQDTLEPLTQDGGTSGKCIEEYI